MIWNAFPASTSYFAPSTSDFMINYAVDEMDAVLAPVSTKGVVILSRKMTPATVPRRSGPGRKQDRTLGAKVIDTALIDRGQLCFRP